MATASSVDDEADTISAFFVLFSALLALVLILSKILQVDAPPCVQTVLPEAGLILLVAMLASGLIQVLAPTNVAIPDADQVNSGDDNDDDSGTSSSVGEALWQSFSPTVFFVALLPPIIFNSGYHLRRELLFRYFTPICLYAVVGTVVSCVVITLVLDRIQQWGWMGNDDDDGSFRPTFTELMAFGALISATDPVSTLAVFQEKRVDPQLFYLVFGESVLNDAVGLVLFQTASKFVQNDNGAGQVVLDVGELVIGFVLDAVGSPVLGVVFGCGAALLFQHLDMRSKPLTELSLYVLLMYVPFLVAQLLGLSGIVTMLFTGITAYAYVRPNVTESTAEHAETFFRLAAHLAETSIFLELGLSVFGLARNGSIQWRFIGWALVACLLGRAAHVYPITWWCNRRVRNVATGGDALVAVGPEGLSSESMENTRIPWTTAHMVCFSGLRGAVAYACSRTFPNTFGNATEFVVATMVIVLVTVFVLGGSTNCALAFLHIDLHVDENKYFESTTGYAEGSSLLGRVEEVLRRNCVRREDASETLPTASPPPEHELSMMTTTTTALDEQEHNFHSMDEPTSPTNSPSSLFNYGKS